MNGNVVNKYVNISGLNLTENNRGTAALGYGAFSFLLKKDFLKRGDIVVRFKYFRSFRDYKKNHVVTDNILCEGEKITIITVPVFFIEKKIAEKIGFVFPCTRFGKIIKKLRWVAAINGGDGFSDIYDTKTFKNRLIEMNIAMKKHIPVIFLPQTLGPFSSKDNKNIADAILKYADVVYIRDDKYISELKKLKVKYEITKDLSAYMQPQAFKIDILPNAVGLNISGLAYSNTFQSLAGQFGTYPYLVQRIISYFQSQKVPLYLIPHSYNFNNPERSNDDLEAIKNVYAKLQNKEYIYIVNRDMIAPEVKFVISKMHYFIGTRMHANFAAIYTHVPLFGLAYSYKFQGAFENNGIFGCTAMINNISKPECDKIVEQIAQKYKNEKK